MTSIALHPTPRRETIVQEQLRAVGLALRTEGILFLAALGVLAILSIAAAIHDAGNPNNHSSFSYGAAATIPMTIIGLVLPFSVWRNEDPARRAYHWAMPMARTPHTLIKMFAGWVWLMAAVAVYLLFLLIMGVVLTLIAHSSGRSSAGAGWQWVVPFTSVTIAYLLGSTAVVASDHPWRWIMGLIAVYVVCLGFTDALGLDGMKSALKHVVDGRYGLSQAIFGKVGHRAARWAGATVIWGAIGAIGVAGAMRRREEG